MSDRQVRSVSAPRRRSGTGRAKFLALKSDAEQRLALRKDPRPWMESNLYIRTKDRRLIPFRFNEAQDDFWQQWQGHSRSIILKPRQLGFTTLVCGRFFADCLLRPNTVSVLVAHERESTERIFRIVKRFWEHLPVEEHKRVGPTQYSSRRELTWPRLGSSFYIGTAGSERFGHGLTINNLHCSEVARWTHPEEILVGLLEAVPSDGRVVYESTANGMGNWFHQEWLRAKQRRSGFYPHFYVWWEEPEYAVRGPRLHDLTAEEKELKPRWRLTDDQIRWRRRKIAEMPRGSPDFREQYPEDDVTCFLASGRCVFDLDALLAMQKRIAGDPGPEAIPLLTWKQAVSDHEFAPLEDKQQRVAPARLHVWQKPENGRRYVIGADVGEGLADGDASAAVVLDFETGRQVAELHGRVPPEQFGQLLNALGWYYQVARLGVERNNHGHSTLNTLRHTCGYPNLYYHVRYDAMRAKASPTLGWPTDATTKPILVDDLAAAIVRGDIVIRSGELVRECMSFVTDDKGNQGAQEGAYDDRVIAAGIAWQLRKRR